MEHLTEDIEDHADRLDGDLAHAALLPIPGQTRRNLTRAGKTAGMSVERKVGYVVQAILAGRRDSGTAAACLEGQDREAVRYGVWRRARLNAKLALALDDQWKREAEAYAGRVK